MKADAAKEMPVVERGPSGLNSGDEGLINVSWHGEKCNICTDTCDSPPAMLHIQHREGSRGSVSMLLATESGSQSRSELRGRGA